MIQSRRIEVVQQRHTEQQSVFTIILYGEMEPVPKIKTMFPKICKIAHGFCFDGKFTKYGF